MEVLWRKLNNLKLYLTARWALRFRRGQRKCSCIRGPARNNNREKLIYVSRTLSVKQLWSTNVINVRLAVAPFAGELACEQQTSFRSSLLSLRNYFSEVEKRRPEIRLLFAGYWRAGFSKSRGLSLSVSFLPLPIPTRSFFGSRSICASQNRKKSLSSVFLCSETSRKRLLRRLKNSILMTLHYPDLWNAKRDQSVQK